MYTSNTAENNANKEASAGISSLKRDVKNAANDAKTHAGKVGEDLKDIAHDAGHQMRDFMDNAGDEISSVTESITARIEKDPVQSALIALGVGFIVGTIFRR